MNEQEIRAAAAHAAAVLMAPAAPSPADYVAVAEVVEAYIRDGKLAAFALCQPQADEYAQSEVPAVPQAAPVETEPVAESEPEAQPTPPILAVADERPASRGAEVISLPPRDAQPSKQNAARSIVERRRKERVDSIMAEASVAKVRAHKQRLLDDADDAGLSEYPVTVKGQNTTLGAYLGSLLGS